MKMKIVQPVNKKALFIASVSLLLGTIFLLFFLISQSGYVIRAGIVYVLIALVLNSITLIGLLFNLIVNHQHYKENLTTIGLFLLNIPITIGYIYIVFMNPLKNVLI